MITNGEIELTQRVFRQVQERLHERQMATLRRNLPRQRAAARLGGERVTGPDMQVKFAILPAYYHYWGQRLGYECWEDEQFVREFLRDNPECRVKSRSGKIMSGWRPPDKRFHKSYGEI